jgi:hypothetical protein
LTTLSVFVRGATQRPGTTTRPILWGTKYAPEELRAHRDRWWSQPALTNAPSGEVAALEAFALETLAALKDPELAVLSALAGCKASSSVNFGKDRVLNVSLVALPRPQLVEGDFDWNDPIECGADVNWPWLILKEAVQNLREKRLLHFHSVDARGGFGSIYLSELGQMITSSPSFPTKRDADPD